MDISSRILEAASRFKRTLRSKEAPPEEPSPVEEHLKGIKALMQDENSSHLLAWLDDQLAAAKAQRNLAFKDHSSLVIAIGFENGLEAVRTFLASLKE